MTAPILRAHRVLTATMAFIAMLGWGAYAYSARSSATRDQQHLDAIGRITAEREALVSEQQRLQRELALANAQLVAAREEIASLWPQQTVAKKGDLGVEPVEPPRKAPQKRTPGAKARSKVGNVIASQR